MSNVFASELKSIKQFPKFNNEIDRNSLAMFLIQFNTRPYSIYEKIYKLEPGQIVKFIQNQTKFRNIVFGQLRKHIKREIKINLLALPMKQLINLNIFVKCSLFSNAV